MIRDEEVLRAYRENDDEFFMRLAIRLAEFGRGFVSPNPLVGAVIVNKGRIVGIGYHRRYGEEHAEVRAIREAGESCKGARMYVSLEPHNFYGKQPPCTKAIIEAGIKEVIIGSLDPNPKVRGKGVKELLNAGIDVKWGVLEDEVRKQNEAFFTFYEKNRPFVALKMALTVDGKIADIGGKSKWITDDFSRMLVHKLRGEYDAIVVGANTVLTDNPLLTPRDVYSERMPFRVVVSGRGNVPFSARIFHTENAPTILITSGEPVVPEGVIVRKIKNIDAQKILEVLKDFGIQSVLVEGGRMMFSTFLNSGLVDKIYAFVSPSFMGKGLDVYAENLGLERRLKFKIDEVLKLENDVLIVMRR
ncbi:MAG: bifunctional diaminohydroxyphosphoribosylaminopyrimidine deaminase/5-amino-6-(5-phosphoribosylamino)uracil reductase RibD [candidate division WOR-3 bacterium]